LYIYPIIDGIKNCSIHFSFDSLHIISTCFYQREQKPTLAIVREQETEKKKKKKTVSNARTPRVLPSTSSRTADVVVVATTALVAAAAITGTCSISDDSVSVAATFAAMTDTAPAATISASPAGLEVAAMAWTSVAVVVMVLGHRAPRPDHPPRW
jgi:hypothetical protein